MKPHDLFHQFLVRCPFIAILRGITPEEIQPVCDALFRAGVRLLEVPLNTPNAIQCIELAAKHVGGKQLVGAGTVLTTQDVDHVADAGGEFIISPNTDAEVIRRTVERELVSIPGFLTPSEGFAAVKAGADYLKLFPAGRFDPSYVKDLKVVLKAPILAVGGMNPENIPAFLKVCAGAGLGSALYVPGRSVEEIESIARSMVRMASAR